MSTIAPSRRTDGIQSPTSSRSSLSVDRPLATGPRRNRTALRDYYGLKTSPAADDAVSNVEDHIPSTELDAPNLNASEYVAKLLARDGLKGILKVQAGLVGEIRGLDGERKALVYDNYSKLIAATATINSMRTNMHPLAPMTTTLEPAMGHIAQTAADLRNDLLSKAVEQRPKEKKTRDGKAETVKWVLDAPRRLETLIHEGSVEEARSDFAEIRLLLDRWKDVEGVEDIRRECLDVLGSVE